MQKISCSAVCWAIISPKPCFVKEAAACFVFFFFPPPFFGGFSMWHALSFLMRQVKCKLRDSFLSLLGSLLVLAVVLVARPISAIEITTDTVALWDLFPQNTQGENGIRLQHRAVGSTDYTDLSYRW